MLRTLIGEQHASPIRAMMISDRYNSKYLPNKYWVPEVSPFRLGNFRWQQHCFVNKIYYDSFRDRKHVCVQHQFPDQENLGKNSQFFVWGKVRHNIPIDGTKSCIFDSIFHGGTFRLRTRFKYFLGTWNEIGPIA